MNVLNYLINRNERRKNSALRGSKDGLIRWIR